MGSLDEGGGGDGKGALAARPLAELRHAMRGRLASFELHLGLLESGPPDRRAHYLAVLHREVELMAALVDELRDGEAEQ